jgi:hypothetical protein
MILPTQRSNIGQLTDVSHCNLQHDFLRKRHRAVRHVAGHFGRLTTATGRRDRDSQASTEAIRAWAC